MAQPQLQVYSAATLAPATDAPPWSLAALAGRYVELCGGPDSAVLTMTAGLVQAAQAAGALAAWVGLRRVSVYPPDLAAQGIDLAALPMVQVDNLAQGARAADLLLRSGAFALIVLDTGAAPPEPDARRPMLRAAPGAPATLPGFSRLPLAAQSRLAGLAKKHQAVLLQLTPTPPPGPEERPAAGSLVAVRAQAAKRRVRHDVFCCTVQGLKDKRFPPYWRHTEFNGGTDGLC